MALQASDNDVPCGMCAEHVGFLCAACVKKTVDAALDEAQSKCNKQVRFLREYEPGPLDENFRGDLELVGCDEVTVYAHRFVMAGKSVIFRKMFETETEKKDRVVRIFDAVAPVLRSVVNYCYTADIRFTDEATVEEVLEIADRYNLNDLKSLCEDELSLHINKYNLEEKVKLAQTYYLKKLRLMTKDFFYDNFDDVFPIFVERLCRDSILDSDED